MTSKNWCWRRLHAFIASSGSTKARKQGGLHSSTSQLNLSAFCGIGGARRGYVARFKGVLWGG